MDQGGKEEGGEVNPLLIPYAFNILVLVPVGLLTEGVEVSTADRVDLRVYLWDGPRVGRANWSCEPINYKPEYFDQRNFAAWRFGQTYPNWNPGLQFPTGDAEAWNQASVRFGQYEAARI